MKHFLLFLSIFLSQHTIAAESKTPEKATMCSACHGASGISINPEWPNLAGQHASYLIKQIQDYKDGKTRNAPIMSSIVLSLSDEDIRALALFYASLAIPENKVTATSVARGETLYRRGDVDKHITACIVCHGPQGTGNEQAGFPSLSGQQPLYTIQQLKAFKEKARSNDINSIMRDISSHMDSEDMTAIAYYLVGLH
jgi:cytochrome c553